MSKLITFGVKEKRRFSTDRRPPHEVFGWVPEGGASAKGNSAFRKMRMCPREYALSNKARLRIIGDHEALTQGITFHFALETYFNVLKDAQEKMIATSNAFADVSGARVHSIARLPKAQREAFLWGATEQAERAAWNALLPMRDEPGYLDTYAELERMVATYFDGYRRKDPWRIVAVEENLEYWIDDVFGYTARLDLVVENIDTNTLLVVEHKSAKTVTDDLREGYQLDQQILGQAWLMKNCVDLSRYPPFHGVIVNITTKHTLPRLERVEVLPSERHLVAFEESIQHWNALEKEFEKRGWPRALGNCAGPSRYWSRCDFYNVCYGAPDAGVNDYVGGDEPPFGYRRATDEDVAKEERLEE